MMRESRIVSARHRLLLVVLLTGCRLQASTVSVTDTCVDARGYACDWIAALEAAQLQQPSCDPELQEHWSEEVRDVCTGQDVDLGIRFGNDDVHFTHEHATVFAASELVPPLRAAGPPKPFEFPGGPGSESLSSESDVLSATADTSLGLLVGIDEGEWGGGLIWSPKRGEPELLFRGRLLAIFEHGGRVYFVSSDYTWRGELYSVTRSGPRSRPRWEIRFELRLPDELVELRRSGDQMLLVTGSGVVELSESGAFVVRPPPPLAEAVARACSRGREEPNLPWAGVRDAGLLPTVIPGRLRSLLIMASGGAHGRRGDGAPGRG